LIQVNNKSNGKTITTHLNREVDLILGPRRANSPAHHFVFCQYQMCWQTVSNQSLATLILLPHAQARAHTFNAHTLSLPPPLPPHPYADTPHPVSLTLSTDLSSTYTQDAAPARCTVFGSLWPAPARQGVTHTPTCQRVTGSNAFLTQRALARSRALALSLSNTQRRKGSSFFAMCLPSSCDPHTRTRTHARTTYTHTKRERPRESERERTCSFAQGLLLRPPTLPQAAVYMYIYTHIHISYVYMRICIYNHVYDSPQAAVHTHTHTHTNVYRSRNLSLHTDRRRGNTHTHNPAPLSLYAR